MKFLKFGTKFLIFPNPNLSCHLDWNPLRISYVWKSKKLYDCKSFGTRLSDWLILQGSYWLLSGPSTFIRGRPLLSWPLIPSQWKAWIFSKSEFSEFRNGSKTCENRPHLISKISIRVHWLIYFVRLIQLVSRRNRKVVCDYRRRYQSVKFTKIDFLEIFFGLIEPNRIFTVWVKRFNLIWYQRSEFYGFSSR